MFTQKVAFLYNFQCISLRNNKTHLQSEEDRNTSYKQKPQCSKCQFKFQCLFKFHGARLKFTMPVYAPQFLFKVYNASLRLTARNWAWLPNLLTHII